MQHPRISLKEFNVKISRQQLFQYGSNMPFWKCFNMAYYYIFHVPCKSMGKIRSYCHILKQRQKLLQKILVACYSFLFLQGQIYFTGPLMTHGIVYCTGVKPEILGNFPVILQMALFVLLRKNEQRKQWRKTCFHYILVY